MYPVKIYQQKTEKQCVDHKEDDDHYFHDIAAAFVEIFHWIMNRKITDDLIGIFYRNDCC